MSAGEPTPWWAGEVFWRKAAIWVTAGMMAILIILTFDSISAISVGSERVPDYAVINKRIYYRHDEDKGRRVPVIGQDAPLFGRTHSASEAEQLVREGKLVIQGRNCMNCHTLLGNGAYYAPDLTKAWLDPSWGTEAARERLMLEFLMDPVRNARGFGTGRRMPDLDLTEREARAVIAYLKWMSAIDTNGFPFGFRALRQGGER